MLWAFDHFQLQPMYQLLAVYQLLGMYQLLTVTVFENIFD